MAVPCWLAQCTETGAPAGLVSVTGNASTRAPTRPSTREGDAIETRTSGAGGSSLRIVPVPVDRPIVAPDGADNVTENIS